MTSALDSLPITPGKPSKCLPLGVLDLWTGKPPKQRRNDGDAKVARSIIVALPCELPLAIQRSLICKYAEWLRGKHGVACEWAIHGPPGDPRNVHAHLLVTTRAVDETGIHGRKLRELDTRSTSKAIITAWRLAWEESCNAALTAIDSDARVDSRSLIARGIARPPRQHLGPEEAARQRRGYPTARGRTNAAIDLYETLNAELQLIKNEYAQIERTQGTQNRIRTAARRQHVGPLSHGRAQARNQRAERSWNLPR